MKHWEEEEDPGKWDPKLGWCEKQETGGLSGAIDGRTFDCWCPKLIVQFFLPAPVSRKGSFKVLSHICLRLLFR